MMMLQEYALHNDHVEHLELVYVMILTHEKLQETGTLTFLRLHDDTL